MGRGGEPPSVRSHQLEVAITGFMEDAARRLQTDVACGAEVGFEVEGRGRSATRTPLYCYRPLTSEFMGERWRALCGSESYRGAVGQLERFEGLDRYIGGPGEPPGPGDPRAGTAEVALWMLLEDVFAEQTEFELRAERLESALERLYRCAGAERTRRRSWRHFMGWSSPPRAPAHSTLRIARTGRATGCPMSSRPWDRPMRSTTSCWCTRASEDPRMPGEHGRMACATCSAPCASSATAASRSGAWRGRAAAPAAGASAVARRRRPFGMLVVTEARRTSCAPSAT